MCFITMQFLVPEASPSYTGKRFKALALTFLESWTWQDNLNKEAARRLSM